MKKSINIYIFSYDFNKQSFLFSTAAQRPQPQVSDRHQVDDMDANNTHKGTPPTATRGAAAATAAATASTSDELGPLPAGWQMSRTENDRLFFIDHINKQTTWIDPRTGKPSTVPAAQRELSENGPLPVNKEEEKRILIYLIL